MKDQKISIMGLGYVGLTTAACFASKGFQVVGFDVDLSKISKINKGEPDFHEPGLKELLKESLKKGFKADSKLQTSDIYFITVGTPSKKDGSIDLTYVKKASEMLGETIRNFDRYCVVVVKSTVIPGTTENIIKPIIECKSGKRFGKDMGLVMNPEFLKEGSAVYDTLNPDRIVIGEFDKRSGDTIFNLYKEFYGQDMPTTLRTNIVNAEFIKYANNAFLATKISFINTIANICQKVAGADVNVIAKGIGLDSRISDKFLRAGLGYGGSCFPKDLKALISFSKSLGYDPILLEAVNEVNVRQGGIAVELARSLLGSLKGKKVAVLGLSFKPKTDDIREAVSLRIIKRLIEEGASVVAYDPAAIDKVSKIFGDKITYAKSVSECIDDTDCCIIVTEWDEFKKLKPDDFMQKMNIPIVIDGRRIYDAEKFFSKVKFAAVGLGSIGLEKSKG